MQDLIREKYLSRIRPFYRDSDMIKVLTGVRRSGKSTIMGQISKEISDLGVKPENIAYIDLDSKKYKSITESDDLEAIIDEAFNGAEGEKFLFLDEVQNVNGFEKLVNAYRKEKVSVFITGSNSYLLSGELVTKLTGRYIEFRIGTFTFSEVREFKSINGLNFSADSDFKDYLMNGGYPKRFRYENQDDMILYVSEVVGETIKKDILRSNKVKDVNLLTRVLDFIASNPAATISSPSIVRYLKNENVNTLPSTINRYLGIIFNSNLASKCERYDIVGKKALRTLYKSYVCDTGLYMFYPTQRQTYEMGHMLENIVYNELLSRGYNVAVGKYWRKEVDFVVTTAKGRAYIQVAYLIPDEETEEREISPLLSIEDNYPKYIISMDPICVDDRGVRKLNLVHDFLLGDGFRI